MHAAAYARIRIQGDSPTTKGAKAAIMKHIDVKVFSVYEGANGIQSLDLVMRNILMNKDMRNLTVFKNRVAATVAKARGVVDEKYITMVERGIEKVDEMVNMMATNLMSKKIGQVLAVATPFQQTMHMMVLAFLHLESLTITVPKSRELTGDLKGADRAKLLESNDDAAYYSGRGLSSPFYISSEFPKFFGKAECVMMSDIAPLAASSAMFTGLLKE